MAKKQRVINLPETKGQVQIKGIVTGTKKDKFFETTSDSNGRLYNNLKFGISVSEDSTIYLENREMKQENVYFYKKSEVKGEKGTTKPVPYAKYKDFNEDGYVMLGMKNGLEKTVDEDGKEKNKLVTLPNFDAVEYMSKQLQDDMAVFVKGNIDFGSYTNKEGDVKRSTKFVPESVFLSSGVDFNAEDYKPQADFEQTFIFMGIEKDDSEKEDVKFTVSGMVVKYSTIENVEFIVRDTGLAKSLKKFIKPYTALKAWGIINNKEEKEELEDAGWGETNPFDKKFKSFTRELVITGVDPSSFDKETYTQEEVDKALKAIRENKEAKANFGEKEETKTEANWGSQSTSVVGEEDLDDLWG